MKNGVCAVVADTSRLSQSGKEAAGEKEFSFGHKWFIVAWWMAQAHTLRLFEGWKGRLHSLVVRPLTLSRDLVKVGGTSTMEADVRDVLRVCAVKSETSAVASRTSLNRIAFFAVEVLKNEESRYG